jgi:hypothetical protein
MSGIEPMRGRQSQFQLGCEVEVFEIGLTILILFHDWQPG